jgi:hypothetical protein
MDYFFPLISYTIPLPHGSINCNPSANNSVVVVRHKSLYYDCHFCGSRNPEKHLLDAPVSSTGQAPQVRHDMPTKIKEVLDALHSREVLAKKNSDKVRCFVKKERGLLSSWEIFGRNHIPIERN